MAYFGSPDRLAAFAGLAPTPWDSGRIRGNLRRPRRYHRRLQRVFYYSALVSIGSCLESRRFYDRKRAEGKRHTQAVLALARRRVNVLWALLRDQRPYRPAPPAAAGPAHQPSHRRLDTCIGKLLVAIAGGSWRPEWCA
jgi:transposase IS116/IS110/IS902 family protein